MTEPSAKAPVGRRTGLVGVVLVLAVAASLWQGSVAVPSSAPLGATATKVVVFAMNPLGFDDLGRGDTPHLDRAVEEGAVAALSVRTGTRRPRLAEGYVSFGGGYRLRSPSTAGVAHRVDEPLATGTAGQVLESRSGVAPTGEIAVLGAPPVFDVNRGRTIASGPGALGDALAAAGRTAAVVGNGDRPGTEPGSYVVNRPAPLAVMDSTMTVAVGEVDPDVLLAPDPLAPYGVRSDPDAMMAAIERAAARADVVFVDPGDLDRADAFRGPASVPAQTRAQADALQHTDALLGRVLDWADDDTLVLVLSVASNGLRPTPLVVVGPGVPRGYVLSPSIKREGMAALTDLAPTVLAALGEDVPATMPGRALRYRAADVDLGVLREYDRSTALREATYYGQVVWFLIFQGVAAAVAALALSRELGRRWAVPAVRLFVLGVAAYPLATFVVRAVPGWWTLSSGSSLLAVVAASAAVAALATRARRSPLSPLHWILGSTVAVLCIDASTGTWLHVNSWLGYSLHGGGRFYGIPNTTFAVLASATLLLMAGHVHQAPRRREALAVAAALAAYVVLVDGWPSLGGDVGGILTLVPVFTLTLLALGGRRLRLRTLAWVGLAAVVGVCLVAGVDLLRPAADRTHLGRFASDLLDEGPSELVTTFLRKQEANFRILRASIWSYLVPIVAAFLFVVLIVQRHLAAVLPRGSALRVGVVATVGGAVLGFATNDSGPVVIALFVAYVVPFVTLVGLHQKWAEPAPPGPSSATGGGDVP